MLRHLLAAAGVLVLLLLPGCNLTLLAFRVPTQVWAGAEFEIEVHANTTSSGLGNGDCAAVLQLPIGFQVLGACARDTGSSSAGPLPIIRDDPTILAAYTPESGHFLAAFSGPDTTFATGPQLKVFLRAPAGTGPFALKVALAFRAAVAGTVWLQDPPGVSQFASIAAAPHAQGSVLVSDPVADFMADGAGLPRGGTSIAWAAVAAGDLDGDGREDLLATSAGGIRAWLSFATLPWLEISNGLPGGTVRRITTGDFDGDGFRDLADAGGRVLLNSGMGSWLPRGAGIVLRSTYRHAVASADIDLDGFDDLAFAGEGPPGSQVIQVFLSDGQGGWREASGGLPNGAGGPISQGLVLADVNGDGAPELVGSSVWARDGLGNWTAASGISVASVWDAAAGDLDGDGTAELVQSGGYFLRIYRRIGPNQWAVVPGTGLPTSVAPSDVVLLDADRDGLLDLAMANAGIQLWRNQGGLRFAPWTNSGLPATSFAGITDLVTGDFNGDTFPDLAAAMAMEGPVVWQNMRTGPSPFGAACTAPGFAMPGLTAHGRPALGNASFGCTVSRGLPNGIAVLWLGPSRRWSGSRSLPFDLGPLGAPGCAVQADPLATAFAGLDGAGTGAFPIPIPPTAALRRMTLFGQAATLAPGANQLGLLLTGGLALRIE